jgi:hypothetical protein
MDVATAVFRGKCIVALNARIRKPNGLSLNSYHSPQQKMGKEYSEPSLLCDRAELEGTTF